MRKERGMWRRMQRANILKCQQEPFGSWLEPFVCGQQKKLGVCRKWKEDNLCSVLSHRTDASVSSDFTTFSWPIRVKVWLKMGAENACWKTSQIVILAQGQTETCSKSFLAVWITYQIQRAKHPVTAIGNHTSSGLLLARGLLPCIQWETVENRLSELQLKAK